MEIRGKVFGVMGLSICTFLIGVFLANLREMEICRTSFCRDVLGDAIGVPLGFFSIILFILAIFFFFTREEIFRSWARFAKVFLSLAAILILGSAFSNQGGGWGVSTNFDTELTTWWLAGIFFAASLVLIIYKSLKLRRRDL